ncbi:MAG: phosphoribosylformylglycinamidine cyclo-ligase [Chitinophagaceae bacterium]|nr:phosphoribosylformylglycinamidine cyclo-ligase [Chitinophagaceae bacterium]
MQNQFRYLAADVKEGSAGDGLYARRGVSAQKEEVHAATKHLDKGLHPKAFCKIFKDVLGGDDNWVNVMHADGAGTKSILAYLYWKETADISVWKGIAQDAIVMNLDDLLCTGIYDNIIFSSTIDRNKLVIPGEVLEAIISGSQDFFDSMKEHGVNITYMGGETADVGDIVRTVAVNGTMTARWPKEKLITNEKIAVGNVIVGLAGFGQAKYEKEYNSGLGSNGLTSARHDLLNKEYIERYPETFDESLEKSVVYIGKHHMSDDVSAGEGSEEEYEVGKLLLSPTRTFAPVIKEILTAHFEAVQGLIHCSGGGQTKCLKYIPDNVRVIKDNLFDPPIVFQLIQEASKAEDKEMYQVFNMGTRMEIYTNEKDAEPMIAIAKKFGVDARVIGRVEENDVREVVIKTKDGELSYQ